MQQSGFDGWRRTLAVVAILALAIGAPAQGAKKRARAAVAKARASAGFVRDWKNFPALAERDTSGRVYVLGDVHGGYDRLVALLLKADIIKTDAAAKVRYSWAAGASTLVCTGDLIDKGDHSLPVLDLMMSIEAQARAAGGAVIVTMGNHEAEFLAKPLHNKSRAFDAELKAAGLEPIAFATRSVPGVWMMSRPVAARVNAWGFAHAGNTGGLTREETARLFKEAVDDNQWGSPFLIGPNSILEDQKWWKDETVVEPNLKAFGVAHIVFGHDPGAMRSGNRGKAAAIRQKLNGRVWAIDVGMSPAVDLSEGALLVIEGAGPTETATALKADGARKVLWKASP